MSFLVVQLSNRLMMASPPRTKRTMQLLLLSLCVWTLVAVSLLASAAFYWSCRPKHASGHCGKQEWLYRALASAGLVSKPLLRHRCPVPVVSNPGRVAMPPSGDDGRYPRRLSYVERERGNRPALFGGYQSWEEREKSFQINHSMQVHCGYVGHSGAHLESWDKEYLKTCPFVVASAIFDSYDLPRQPWNVSAYSHHLFCFVMLVDQASVDSMRAQGRLTQGTGNRGKWVGIWRLLLLHNPPYDEPRRNGKLPKLLAHRLFPHTRYSIWVDAKLELVMDPLLILERYLWRNGHTFAISRHKLHQSIYQEADANKRRKKYARPLIDRHMSVYRKEGMQAWSSAKLPLVVSDVPEGGMIIREHTPLTNLFCCLWFNEVNRFTPRDQLSFGYVVYRLNGAFPFFMFPNCEYNSLAIPHTHTRQHSSNIEWLKTLDDLANATGIALETRAGMGLWTPPHPFHHSDT